MIDDQLVMGKFDKTDEDLLSVSTNQVTKSYAICRTSQGLRLRWMLAAVASFCLVVFSAWMSFVVTMNIIHLQNKIHQLDMSCSHGYEVILSSSIKDQINAVVDQVSSVHLLIQKLIQIYYILYTFYILYTGFIAYVICIRRANVIFYVDNHV